MKKVNLTLKQTLRFAFTGLLAISLFSSCKKDDPYDFEDTIAADVNFINTSPDAPAAQLYIEDILRTPNSVAYGQASGYNKTFLGDQDVVIKSASGEATLSSSHVQFDAYGSYTFFLVGQNSSLGLIAVTDDLTAPAAGKAKIRFVNASPNATSVSLAIGGSIIAANQSFRAVSPSVEIAAGTYSVVLSNVAGGTTTTNTTANTSFQAGKIYTVYAKGLVGSANASAFTTGIFVNK
jgi:hypothetical protein